MSGPTFVRSFVLCLIVLFVAAACSNKTPERKTDPTGSSSRTTESGGFSGETITDNTPGNRAVAELATVYFDYDRSDVREDARRGLRSNSTAIQNNAGWGTVTLEGHCDERGSEEYNLALGERRATAAKRYLVDLGVPSSRVQTVSFGETSPAVQGHDESAWQWNRRVEFRVAK